jgi:lysophospholipase L1-like esterase
VNRLPDQAVKAKNDGIARPHPVARAALSLALLWPVIGCNSNPLLIPDPSVRYVAFGDSSTAGRAGRAYPEILSALLGQPADAVANQGQGGETTGAGLHRLRRLISRAIYPNAETLLYWQGGADIVNLVRQVDGQLLVSPSELDYPYAARLAATLDRVQANIEAAITEGQAAGMTVCVATYFSLRETTAECDPLSLDVIQPAQARTANAYVSLLNERIRQAAGNTGATVVDIASANDRLHADDSCFVDCNHLSEKGNEIVARVFAEALGLGDGG